MGHLLKIILNTIARVINNDNITYADIEGAIDRNLFSLYQYQNV